MEDAAIRAQDPHHVPVPPEIPQMTSDNKSRAKSKRWLNWLPFGILLGGITYTLYTAATTDVIFTYKNYGAIFLLLACAVFMVLKPRPGKILLLITILLGTFNLIAFTPTVVTYRFYVTSLKIGPPAIQVFSFFVLLLFVVVNFDKVKAWKGKLLTPKVYENME
ncbi:hypothetical protein EGT74_24890 [Chitinophaga lutea]|uniref:Uncharacterized protein n=1 Tax=Chitinophaga lutea TaxID=2488634 RepID=A0A3N4PBJ9_9BACT|nr:hypothetical protein [Chitinophaga lutea]RPE05616.1 hypothetical protein EGT74_24890 [Chitinophaga lutea]